MRIGMRLLLGYFLLVAVAAWFVLAIFVKEVKPGVRRATEGTLIDTATLLAELARPDLLSGDPTHGQLAQAWFGGSTALLPGSLAMLIPSLTISPFLSPISVVASCVNSRRRWKVCA